MAPASLSSGFQSFTPIPTIKLGPSGAGSPVGGLVHTPGPCGSLQRPLLRGWESLLLPPQPPQAFSLRGLRLYFPLAGALGCAVCFTALPPVYLCTNVGPRGLLVAAMPAPFPTSHCLILSPLCPSCLSPSLLLVWMNVSSLSPWLLAFHTVCFSVSSGCFLFLNCCCPSLGYAGRHSVSTYASILATSH